jgi:hypothetical protein
MQLNQTEYHIFENEPPTHQAAGLFSRPGFCKGLIRAAHENYVKAIMITMLHCAASWGINPMHVIKKNGA